MSEFESWRQYWDFSHFVMRKARHIFDAKNQRFLDVVVETSAKRKNVIKKGEVLWTAQLGNDWRTETIRDDNQEEIDSFEVENPHPPEIMRPIPDRAYEGRVNPKGIPCFYCSTDMETAMTETRPWIGSSVSVAQFVLLRDLRVVDCSSDSKQGFLDLQGREPDPAVREESVWGDINRAFSLPITRNDDVAEYAPTQVLGEVFKSAGYDGIVYGSKLGTGNMIAIFDIVAAQQINGNLFRVDSINPKYSRVTSAMPYYVGKYYDGAKATEFTVPTGQSGSLDDD